VAKLTTLKSTYALATTPVDEEPWPGRALIWEKREPYFYARSTADGRIVIGGEDEDFVDPAARNALIDVKSRTLMRKLRELLPHLDGRQIKRGLTDGMVSPAFQWAGTFAETEDGLPYIGTLPLWPEVHFALGYGGNGITFSMIAAGIIRDAVLGHADESARLFKFERASGG
ncbi:MAG: FAD-binding oxidoreductase, partial [Pyrinomonadaceae bacterium]|nr:FAD-binding oxidoreductase [Phycisphaerales bacterium]